MIHKVLIGIFLIYTVISCTSKSEKQGDNNTTPQSSSSSNDDNSYQNASSNNSTEENYVESNEENNEYSNGCKFEDGTYSATIDYYNPETGYSATYTLDVEVQDCQIVQINFPNNGYLDEDHITYADIDEDGHATVDGEDGKTYAIQLDN
jgi:hypothetical protein